MANIKLICKSHPFRERTLKFQKIRPGQRFVVKEERAVELVKGDWAYYVDPPKEKKEKKIKEETKELKEVKNEETK